MDIILIGNCNEYIPYLRRSANYNLVCHNNLTDERSEIQDIDFNTLKVSAIIVDSKENFLKYAKYADNFIITSIINNADDIKEIIKVRDELNINVCFSYPERFNPTITSLKKILSKENDIYSINIIRAKRSLEDKLETQSMQDIDLLRFLLNSEVSEFAKSKSKFLHVGEVASMKFCMSNGTVVSTINSQLYLNSRKIMEISCDSGFYIADLQNFTLRKNTDTGLVNFRVDSEISSIQTELEYFYKLCKDGDFGLLARLEDVLKVVNIIK